MTDKISRFFEEVRRRGPIGAVRYSIRWLMMVRRERDPALVEHVRHHNDFLFERLNVSRDEVTVAYRETASKVGIKAGPNDSFNRMAFSALATAGFRPKTILELGTSHGDTTLFLAETFPGAEIHTIELPDDDPIYDRTHPPSDERNLRARRLDAYPNIKQIRCNTVWLQDLDLPEFDLIWLDAGHHYPEVAWDHFFCMKKIRPGGWILTDDVMLPDNPLVLKNPGNGDVWACITYFNKRQTPQFELLLKRELPRQFLVNPKYVGLYHQPDSSA